MKVGFQIYSLFLVTILLTVAAPQAAWAQQSRVALVVGNSDYDIAPLRNPENDARDVAKVLEEQLGFKTQLVLDSNQAEMQRAIREFSQNMEQADVRLFYYAGHGVSVDGENYMVPIDADIGDEDEVEWEAVKTSLVLEQMEKLDFGANLLILDACRDNPLPKSTRSGSRGLNKMNAPTGSLILYATAPGQVAEDGAGRNGTFTKHLLRSLAAPNVHLGDIALDVRVAVMKDTNNRQVPWSESSLTQRVYLAGRDVNVSADLAGGSEKADEPGSSTADASKKENKLAGSTVNQATTEVPASDDYESSIVTAYAAAAEAGDPVAQARLGYIFDVGRSVQEDNAKARHWYEKASKQQQWDATVNLAVMYLNGDGVSQDKKRAFDLFSRAANANHSLAQRNLGAMFQYGDTIAADYDKARFWFEKAASQGNIAAFSDLGDLYSHGLGVTRDDSEAYRWYLKAARQGSASAQSEVGYFLDQGLGVPRNYEKAVEWFQRAAEQGYPLGMFNLAEMYELGKGISTDLNKAQELYARSAELGNESAKQAIIRLQQQ